MVRLSTFTFTAVSHGINYEAHNLSKARLCLDIETTLFHHDVPFSVSNEVTFICFTKKRKDIP